MRPAMRLRVAVVSLATLILILFVVGSAQAQGRVEAADFTVQLFVSGKGEFSPDVFKIEELGVHNFTFQGKNLEGGKFSGFLVRVEFRSPKEVFAQGRQAQIVFRDIKTKKVLKTWNISDVYVGDNGIAYRAAFFEDLDCSLMSVTLTSGKTRISRELPFHCGE
jgi:hypothetical protein